MPLFSWEDKFSSCPFSSLKKHVKGKVTLFNVVRSLSYEAGINGSWQCTL